MRIVVSLPLLALASCAFTNVTVTPPRQPVAAAQSGGNGRTVIVSVPLTDARPMGTRCGMQKNGYNMATAEVICSANPATWLAELLASELRAAGFTVLAPTFTIASALRVDGQLLQYFVEPKIDFFTFSPEADIHVRLVASTPGGLVAERDFYVKGVETSLVGVESNFQAASDSAVRQIVAAMVTAVRELMDRYPGVGAQPFATPAS